MEPKQHTIPLHNEKKYEKITILTTNLATNIYLLWAGFEWEAIAGACDGPSDYPFWISNGFNPLKFP